MAKQKAKELRAKSINEIRIVLKDLKKQLMKFNNQIKTGTPPEKPGEVKKTKKTIARILTILREREIEAQKKSSKKTKIPITKKIKTSEEKEKIKQ